MGSPLLALVPLRGTVVSFPLFQYRLDILSGVSVGKLPSWSLGDTTLVSIGFDRS